MTEDEAFEVFIGWMADRLLERNIETTREKAIWLARCFMQIEESDGQRGGNKMFRQTPEWNERYAHELADAGVQRQIWEDEEC